MSAPLGYSIHLHARAHFSPTWRALIEENGEAFVSIELDPSVTLIINKPEQLEALAEILWQAESAFRQGIE